MQKHHYAGLGGLGAGSITGVLGAIYAINGTLSQIVDTCGKIASALPLS